MKLLNVGNVGKIFYVALTEKVVHEVSFLIIENNEINLQALHSKYSSRSNIIFSMLTTLKLHLNDVSVLRYYILIL